MNLKGFGRKRSWSNLRHYTINCNEILRKSTKILSQDSMSTGRDLNPGPLKYEARALTGRPQHSLDALRTRDLLVVVYVDRQRQPTLFLITIHYRLRGWDTSDCTGAIHCIYRSSCNTKSRPSECELSSN
jgi:hypothetical protein